jgi:virginiamycin B lyase
VSHSHHMKAFAIALSMLNGPCLAAADGSTIPGTGSLAGTVTAAAPFRAAQVYARNAEKNLVYMVYTASGRYRAVNVMPGNYEVSVERRGFASEPRKVAVRGGQTARADFTLSAASPAPRADVPGPATITGYPGAATLRGNIEFVSSYDALYPPGPGRAVAEKTCMACHGLNFFPQRQWDRTQWSAAVDRMTRREGTVGIIVPPGKLSPKDRALLVDYFAANFGPGSKPRGLATDAEVALDEEALAKAMYIEYIMPKASEKAAPRGQNPYFDADGNVWMTDRGSPNGIVRLDPRTAIFKQFLLPEQGGPHGITVDSEGTVWWGENAGFKLGQLDPKSGKITRHALDPSGFSGTRNGQDPIVDSKQNVWFTVIVGNKIGKMDRQTGKLAYWEPPTPNSYPYGIDKDKDDNIWFSQFVQCRVTRFDPRTQTFTEFPVLTAYEDPFCLIRRLGVDGGGLVWYGVFSHGVIGRLDPATGQMKEYKVPAAFSQPYDVWPDRENNIWISDAGMGGALVRFDPRTEKFTFYPSPQRGDMPKIEITHEGAIWYNPRSSMKGAAGVLYPDVAKMKAFEARY